MTSLKPYLYPEFSREWFFISGASSGIGFAVAEQLARSGASIIAMARRDSLLNDAKEKWLDLGAHAVELAPLDLTDKNTAAQAREWVGDRMLRGILLNGGGPHGGTASRLTWDDYEHANRLLLSGPATLLTALLPTLKHHVGSVVAIASTTVKEPNPNLALSAAYRSGLIAFLKTLSDELGPTGIRVNAVAPGYTDTDRLNELALHVAQHGSNTQDTPLHVRETWASVSALKRIATPNEISAACAFLFSSQASFMTGQTLVVDGGQVRGY